MAQKKSKGVYYLETKVELLVKVEVRATNIQEAVDYVASLKHSDLAEPSEDCEILDGENKGIVSVSAEGFQPFKS